MGQIPRQTAGAPPPTNRHPAEHQYRARRALTNVGGDVSVEAVDPDDKQLLLQALNVRADDTYATSHLHGFHAYPARLHARTAGRLIDGLSRPGQTVLDPFCGSGTVLLEARLAGRSALGIDANPLAIALSSLKLRGSHAVQRDQLITLARGIMEMAESRRQSKAGPSRRYCANDRAQFDPHVLLELDGLYAGICQVVDPYCHDTLMLVLSSLLNKVSRRASDTSAMTSNKRWAAGFVIKFFGRKVAELVNRLAELENLLAQTGFRKSSAQLGDARRLPFRNGSVVAVITSPPYPGIYDYIEHHRIRLRWLGLDQRHLDRHEIGAKRHSQGQGKAIFRGTFNQQLRQCLAEMARVMAPRGSIALVVADSVIDQEPWYADREIANLASQVGLSLVAHAAQRRRHFHAPTELAFGRRPRCERLLLLRSANRGAQRTQMLDR